MRSPLRSRDIKPRSSPSSRSLIRGARTTVSRKMARARSYTGVFFCACTYVRSMYIKMSRIMIAESLCFSHLSFSASSTSVSFASSTCPATAFRCVVTVSTSPVYSLSPNLCSTMLYALRYSSSKERCEAFCRWISWIASWSVAHVRSAYSASICWLCRNGWMTNFEPLRDIVPRPTGRVAPETAATRSEGRLGSGAGKALRQLGLGSSS